MSRGPTARLKPPGDPQPFRTNSGQPEWCSTPSTQNPNSQNPHSKPQASEPQQQGPANPQTQTIGPKTLSPLRRNVPTEGPMWGHPMPVLGALIPFLEPFCVHLSPKIDKVSEKLTLRYPHEEPCVGYKLAICRGATNFPFPVSNRRILSKP